MATNAGRLTIERRAGGQYVRTPVDLLGYPGVSLSAAGVYGVLRTLPSARERDMAFPGQRWIAARLRIGQRSVLRYLDELHNSGWITIEPVDGETSNYHLHDPRIARDAVDRRPKKAPEPSSRPSETHANLAWVPTPIWRGGVRQIGVGGTPDWRGSMDVHVPNQEEEEVEEDTSSIESGDAGAAQLAMPGVPPETVRAPLVRRRPIAAAQTWQAALEDLRGVVTGPSFANWIAHTEAVRHDGATFAIATPSNVAREWLETRFRPQIEAALHRITGRPTQLEVVVEQFRGGAP